MRTTPTPADGRHPHSLLLPVQSAAPARVPVPFVRPSALVAIVVLTVTISTGVGLATTRSTTMQVVVACLVPLLAGATLSVLARRHPRGE